MCMKMIIFNNKLGDIVRIGLYDENGKWIKWLSKKLMDEYIDKVDSVENKILQEVNMIKRVNKNYRIKHFYYCCSKCGRQIDSYEYYKNDGVCDICQWM